ncbi:hypothetical protein EDC04DRAFT_2871383 [Pisolithus marmoratus]|nr:hypothetical protein EDC04DRAFT_2871383 [Pisolithus marmoratus]
MVENNNWYPFTSCVEFETAEFLFTENQMPQAQVDRLMQLWTASILPYNDVPWSSFQVQYAGDVPESAPCWMVKGYNVWFHDANAVVKSLLSNTDFHEHFDYIPYHEFEPSGQHRWENFMSGNWAWHHADILAQDAAMHGAMLVPIILGSDKTTVSVATGQNDYYPLYLSIGNIHNKVHCAHWNALVLLAFLAIPKVDRESEDSAEFWNGMSKPEVWQCPDGHFCHAAYALSAYIADYPEQILLSCLMQGWCPLCTNMSNNLDGMNGLPWSQEHAEYCIHAFAFAELWDQYGIVGDLMPFTNDFPHANIYKLLMPDLLHQIIKGIFKDHLVTWISEYLKITYGEAEANHILDDINHRIAAWTGDDSKALMKVYLPAIEGHVPPRVIFQETGVCEHGPKGFSLPWQHSMTHYWHLIQEFGAPNGLSLGQMLVTNHHLDKLAVARVNFENRGMLQGSLLSAAMQEVEHHGTADNGDAVSDVDQNDADNDETQTDDSPRVPNYVCLAKTPVCKFPTDIHALACHIQEPSLPILISCFLHFHLHADTNPSTDGVALPDLSNSPISVFCSAISTFYAPSDLSGLGGMHMECIWSTSCWDPNIPGMGGLHIARVFLFFSFSYDGIKYPYAPDNDTGMWVIQPDLDANGQCELEVVHVHCILCGAYLIPVYECDCLPTNIQHTNSLDIFQAYYVNKYIDHHAFKIAF